MALPKEISPNPLVTSTVEVRFRSEVETQKLFPVVYSKFSNNLPFFNESKIPKELRGTNPDFAFAPDYTLKNDDYSLSFSNKVIVFENISEYKLWNNYFPFIKEHLDGFFQLGVVKQIERIGLRYASIFDKTESVNQVLKTFSSFPTEGYTHEFNFYRGDLNKDGFDFHLQVANNAKVTKNNKSMTGVYIDIDASLNGTLEPSIKVFEIIEQLHQQEKELFFSLLKPEFVNTLNPKY